ncbi:carbonic anhydrase [Diaporthe helianthi]|uniref:Carbonic anhydrase n=1 Tax=Diaporthe helianthi TaxID=158607 RepID=A0A2P5HPR7_DIAHE|nr:carbonic anhydrase [Diaporthe helianthi]
MSTPNVQNLKNHNATYAATFTHVTCMDARIDPVAAFGISLGDAHVVRNAGGSAREALRSIVISQQLLGTWEIILIKHTGCGMLTFANKDAHGLVAQRLGAAAAAEIATLDFLAFTSLHDAVHEDIDFLKRQSAVPKDVNITGWVYQVETGKATQVV